MSVLHGWRFCPRCGAELRLEPGAQTPVAAACPACGSSYYANSAPTVGALCEDEDGRLLLVRRAIEPSKRKWDTPGGFLEEGEEPRKGLKRELREETGLEIEPGEFFAAVTDVYGEGPEAQYVLSLNWTATVAAATDVTKAEPADDISELRWFSPSELPPPEEIAFPSVREVLELWLHR